MKTELDLEDLESVCGGASSRKGLSRAELAAATQGRADANRQKDAEADKQDQLRQLMSSGGGMGGLGGMGGMGGMGGGGLGGLGGLGL